MGRRESADFIAHRNFLNMGKGRVGLWRQTVIKDDSRPPCLCAREEDTNFTGTGAWEEKLLKSSLPATPGQSWPLRVASGTVLWDLGVWIWRKS
jgi:hypothetical protein